MAGIDAFGLLKEELKSEEIQDQVNAARRVNTIALGMGEDRARSELIPFLKQRVDEYTDEILLVSACITRARVRLPTSIQTAILCVRDVISSDLHAASGYT